MTSNPHLMNQANLAKELYQDIYNTFESFQVDNIGSDLAYLMGEILTDGFCIFESNSALNKFLKTKYDTNHEIWRYIK
jgi:hypothetical protein